MIWYKKIIDSNAVTIGISDFLYIKEKRFFDIVLQSFEKYNSGDKIINVDIYIKIPDEEEVNCKYLINCDMQSKQWKYWVIHDLSEQFIKVINCTAFHGTGVVLRDKVILLIGASMAGKTTLAHDLCVKYNAKYIDDDNIFFLDGNCFGLNFPMALRSNVREDYSNSIFVDFTDDAVTKDRQLISFYLNENRMRKVDYIIFPEFSKQNINSFHKVFGCDLINRLLKNVKSNSSLDTIYRDVSAYFGKVNAFEMKYSNSIDAVKLLNQILETG